MGTRVVSAQRTIAAPAQAIFDVLADPARHQELDGSGTVHAPRRAPARLFLGAKFAMDMRMGVPYVTANRVVEFDEPRRIAWHHTSRFVWRYELEEVEGGTRVTESFDYSVPWGLAIVPLGVPQKNQRSMERSLERLEALVTKAPEARA